MTYDDKIIKDIKNREYTYAIVKNEEVIFNFKGSGIGAVAKTIMIDSSMLNDAIVYDTYVGKAVASLLLKYHTSAVYGESMTQVAMDIFDKNGINYSYGEKVEMIYNHDESAECPFEIATKNIDDLDKIEEKVFDIIKELKASKNG